MARVLDVYLHSNRVGQLTQDDHGQMSFMYIETWLTHPKAMPLSQSLPLRAEHFSRKECRPFFSGILPESHKREVVARNLGISERNDFAMLERIGGECAGAVTFVPENEKLPQTDNNYRPLTEEDLTQIIRKLPRKPLMAGEEGVRLSLAGAQDKIAVCLQEDRISLPLDGAPSTHILKPAIEGFEGIVFNEALCMHLAAQIGITTAATEIRQTHDGTNYLLIKRYDRVYNDEGAIQRLHQEDFCQALGVTSETKYQNEGGPSLKICFHLLRDVSTTPVLDLQELLNAVIFNFLVGNNDAHGKNFSLLYNQSLVRIAPLYDILSTALYPDLSKRMAMKLGGEYEADRIFPHHFEKLAQEVGFGKALVKGRVRELTESTLAALDKIEVSPRHSISDQLINLIRGRCLVVQGRFGEA
jgi:serine/threonine-protein kinase HipA